MITILKRIAPQTFNDTLAIWTTTLIFLLIAADSAWIDFNISDMWQGAMIPVLTLIAQFYYRKAKGEGS